MRLTTLLLTIPLLSLVACDPPDDETMLEALDDEADLAPADPQAPDAEVEAWNESLDLTSSGSTAWKCHCWTNCSSNGKNWTKMYWVGSYATKKICNAHAKSFCKGKARDYIYPNAGCGKHP